MDRSKGIGGSDVGGIFGLSKWKSPLSIYMSKIEGDEEKDNQFIEWGNKLEPIVAEKFSEVTGKKLLVREDTIVSDSHDFIIAHIDRQVENESAGLEVKTATQYKSSEWDDQVPEEYILQCMHYMYCTGFDKWYICVLIGGNDFRWFTIERDQEMIDAIVEKEVEFWNEHVLKKVPPEPIGSDTEFVNKLFSKSNGKTVQFDNGMDELLKDLTETKKSIKHMENVKKELENKLKVFLGNNEFGSSDKFRVSWKEQTRSGIDSKILKNEFPLVYGKVKTESSHRRLLVKELL